MKKQPIFTLDQFNIHALIYIYIKFHLYSKTYTFLCSSNRSAKYVLKLTLQHLHLVIIRVYRYLSLSTKVNNNDGINEMVTYSKHLST